MQIETNDIAITATGNAQQQSDVWISATFKGSLKPTDLFFHQAFDPTFANFKLFPQSISFFLRPSDYINSTGWSISKSENFADTSNKVAFEPRDHELDSITRDDVESERSLIANGAAHTSKVNAMNINVET